MLLADFLWCGGWACYAAGAFRLLLSTLSPLYSRCSSAPWSCLSVSACICCWWLGSECVIASASRWTFSVGLQAPTTWKQELGLFGDVTERVFFVCFLFWSVWVKAFFFFLAWLIRMLLAGSCPNRGCHLIKSIICWLNLLELRRKRSVHALSHSACLSVSLTYPLIHLPVSRGREKHPQMIHS